MMQHARTAVRARAIPLAARMSNRQTHTGTNRVLIMQPDHLGDILLSQPSVTMLRELMPNDELIAVVGPWSREIASLAWPVDRVVAVDFPGFARVRKRSPIAPYTELRRAARSLISLDARAAVVLRPDAWWATWLASLVAPLVVTSNDPQCVPFATSVTAVPDQAHSAVRAFTIASQLVDRPGAVPTPSSRPLHLPPSAHASDEARALLCQQHVDGPYIVIHSGSGAPVKEWPAHRWAQIARFAIQRGLNVILSGSAAERQLAVEIADAAPGTMSLAGRTSVAVLAELLRGASVAVGPDCGPLHLAVATGTPTVHLFGPSDPTRYGPWGDSARHRVLRADRTCPRCGDLARARASGCGCMLAIQTSMVTTALDELLGSNHAS